MPEPPRPGSLDGRRGPSVARPCWLAWCWARLAPPPPVSAWALPLRCARPTAIGAARLSTACSAPLRAWYLFPRRRSVGARLGLPGRCGPGPLALHTYPSLLLGGGPLPRQSTHAFFLGRPGSSCVPFFSSGSFVDPGCGSPFRAPAFPAPDMILLHGLSALLLRGRPPCPWCSSAFHIRCLRPPPLSFKRELILDGESLRTVSEPLRVSPCDGDHRQAVCCPGGGRY